jgi:hypothetical protein
MSDLKWWASCARGKLRQWRDFVRSMEERVPEAISRRAKLEGIVVGIPDDSGPKGRGLADED